MSAACELDVWDVLSFLHFQQIALNNYSLTVDWGEGWGGSFQYFIFNYYLLTLISTTYTI